MTEAFDREGELFGEERLVEVMNTGRDAGPEEVIGIVSNALAEYTRGAEQSDDITMLCLEYRGA